LLKDNKYVVLAAFSQETQAVKVVAAFRKSGMMRETSGAIALVCFRALEL